jgi:hypothetical protein
MTTRHYLSPRTALSKFTEASHICIEFSLSACDCSHEWTKFRRLEQVHSLTGLSFVYYSTYGDIAVVASWIVILLYFEDVLNQYPSES